MDGVFDYEALDETTTIETIKTVEEEEKEGMPNDSLLSCSCTRRGCCCCRRCSDRRRCSQRRLAPRIADQIAPLESLSSLTAAVVRCLSRSLR